MKLLRISRIKPGENFPFGPSWAYKALHLKKYPNLFVKIGSAVFIDLAEFWRMVEAGRIQ